MSKEAIFSPDFPASDEGNGFAVRPDTGNQESVEGVLSKSSGFLTESSEFLLEK